MVNLTTVFFPMFVSVQLSDSGSARFTLKTNRKIPVNSLGVFTTTIFMACASYSMVLLYCIPTAVKRFLLS